MGFEPLVPPCEPNTDSLLEEAGSNLWSVSILMLVFIADDFRTLHTGQERRDLAWRYGIGLEILDSVRRATQNQQRAAGNGEDFSLMTSQTGATLFQAR